MQILQSFADDSGSDPQSHTFVLGGLVAQPGEWVLFTQEWQAALDSGPIKLDYLKTSEAMSLNGQVPQTIFAGGPLYFRDEKNFRVYWRHNTPRSLCGVGINAPLGFS